MSARRSARTKAPVKYTSDSEGSDFGTKKARKTPSKKDSTTTPKKRKQDAAIDTNSTPKKRTKKDPETLAAEYAAKASAQEEKAAKQAHKKTWEEWLKKNDVGGALLENEPEKEESITQTDAGKKYSLKPEDLGVLKHFEKRHPIYNNTTKLFLEEDVKVLAFRKYAILAGVEGDEKEVLKKGEEIWKEEHKDDVKEVVTLKKSSTATPKKTDKPKTPKQKWTTYVEAHTVASPQALDNEPDEAINQTDSKTKYSLIPGDLAVLPYFPKPNPKYGNTTKLFKESEVKVLAYRKAAYLGGVDDGDEEAVLKKGKDLFEEGKKGE